MSTPVTFNGVVYSIPAYGDTGYAQGTGNLSSYLIALAGGPFPFTSQTANPATAGQIRLAKTDTIDWRNNANSANLPLGINGSDQLTFNGTPLATSGGGTVNLGTAGNGAYYATTSTAISDAGAAAVTFGSLVASFATLTSAANQLQFHAANSTVINCNQASTNRTITIPDPGGNDVFALLAKTQTFSGTETFSNTVNLTGNLQNTGLLNTTGTGVLAIQSTSAGLRFDNGGNSLTLLASPTSTHTYTFPELGINANFVMTEGTQTINGIKTLATQGIIHGTSTNDNATAGFIGEYVSATSGSSGDINGVNTNLTSMSLTAGDWDVRGNAQFNPAGGTLVKTITVGTSTTSATFGAVDATTQKNYTTVGVAFSLAEYAPIPTYRYSLSGTTTIYMVAQSNATASITGVGYLSARRVR